MILAQFKLGITALSGNLYQRAAIRSQLLRGCSFDTALICKDVCAAGASVGSECTSTSNQYHQKKSFFYCSISSGSTYVVFTPIAETAASQESRFGSLVIKINSYNFCLW